MSLITPEQWESIKAAGIKKHEEGLASENHLKWWIEVGQEQCSFCKVWLRCGCTGRYYHCPLCPLARKPCCEEWNTISNMDHWNDEVFIKNETALLEKIKALTYDDLPEVKAAREAERKETGK
jgi:hypothetical protein